MDVISENDLIYSPKVGLFTVVAVSLDEGSETVNATVSDGIKKERWTFSINDATRFSKSWYLSAMPRIREY